MQRDINESQPITEHCREVALKRVDLSYIVTFQ